MIEKKEIKKVIGLFLIFVMGFAYIGNFIKETFPMSNQAGFVTGIIAMIVGLYMIDL